MLKSIDTTCIQNYEGEELTLHGKLIDTYLKLGSL